jgi:hypothetical protein
MDTFSFVFSLYSIILGLALTEVLGGAARAIERRRKFRMGWAAGLLAATLVADITLFWRIIWRTRAAIPDTSAALFAGVIICGLYYFAAVLVFPKDDAEDAGLDGHVMAEKSRVLACIWLANALAYACRCALIGRREFFAGWGWTNWAEVAAFMGACAAAIFVRDRRILIALIAIMLAADLIDPVFALLGIGT